jgi:hypothetical protein
VPERLGHSRFIRRTFRKKVPAQRKRSLPMETDQARRRRRSISIPMPPSSAARLPQARPFPTNPFGKRSKGLMPGLALYCDAIMK